MALSLPVSYTHLTLSPIFIVTYLLVCLFLLSSCKVRNYFPYSSNIPKYPYLCSRYNKEKALMKEDPRHITISEFNYPLPDERIAKFPLPVRDQSKLLLYRHGDCLLYTSSSSTIATLYLSMFLLCFSSREYIHNPTPIQSNRRSFTDYLSVNMPIPVSYTHLDVYKRQLSKRCMEQNMPKKLPSRPIPTT